MPHITTCPHCGKCYEEISEEMANWTHRSCGSCRVFRYLVSGTVTDPGFRNALERADVATLERALEDLKGRAYKKTAVAAVQARLRRLTKREATAADEEAAG